MQCIKQDHVTKHGILDKMGNIYPNAIVTIVAAAGEDAAYGLPGVGSTKRTPQYESKTGQCTLRQVFPFQDYALRETKWASRAWTYQEGYLSIRRLIFTDHQAHFLCNHSFVEEYSVLSSIEDSFYKAQRSDFWDLVASNDPVGLISRLRVHLEKFEGQISQYSTRQLSS
jgi:hypothetical protein